MLVFQFQVAWMFHYSTEGNATGAPPSQPWSQTSLLFQSALVFHIFTIGLTRMSLINITSSTVIIKTAPLPQEIQLIDPTFQMALSYVHIQLKQEQ